MQDLRAYFFVAQPWLSLPTSLVQIPQQWLWPFRVIASSPEVTCLPLSELVRKFQPLQLWAFEISLTNPIVFLELRQMPRQMRSLSSQHPAQRIWHLSFLQSQILDSSVQKNEQLSWQILADAKSLFLIVVIRDLSYLTTWDFFRA